MAKSLGEAIRARREEMGLSQVSLSEIAGVGREWLSTLETGAVKNPSATRLAQLAGALGVNVGDLLDQEPRNAIVIASQITEARRTAGQLLNLLAEIDPSAQSEGVRVVAVASKAFSAGLDAINHNHLATIETTQITLDVIRAIKASGAAWVVGALVAGDEPDEETAAIAAAMIDKGQV